MFYLSWKLSDNRASVISLYGAIGTHGIIMPQAKKLVGYEHMLSARYNLNLNYGLLTTHFKPEKLSKSFYFFLLFYFLKLLSRRKSLHSTKILTLVIFNIYRYRIINLKCYSILQFSSLRIIRYFYKNK